MTDEFSSEKDSAVEKKLDEYRARETTYQAQLEELENRESFNFALFQYNPNATVIVDREGRVVKSNIAKRSSGDRMPEIGDVMYRDYANRHSEDMHSEMIDCIKTGGIKTFPRLAYGGKTLAITMAGFPNGAIITTQDITARVQAEDDRDRLIDELRRALDEVEQLRGLLPICACCKKIRDDGGYWQDIETYITEHSKVNFSHAMCPDCTKKMYPEIYDRIFNKDGSTPP